MESKYTKRLAKLQIDLRQKGILRSKDEIFEIMVELLKRDVINKNLKKE